MPKLSTAQKRQLVANELLQIDCVGSVHNHTPGGVSHDQKKHGRKGSTSVDKPKISSTEIINQVRDIRNQGTPFSKKLEEYGDLIDQHPDHADRVFDSAIIDLDQKEINQVAVLHYEKVTGQKMPTTLRSLRTEAKRIGATVVLDKPRATAKAISDRLLEIYQHKARSNRRDGDLKEAEYYDSQIKELLNEGGRQNKKYVEENWMSGFRKRDWFEDSSNKQTSGVTSAFNNLDRDKVIYTQMGAIAAKRHGNSLHDKMTKSFPNVVAFHRAERIMNRAVPNGYYRTITHIPDGFFSTRNSLISTSKPHEPSLSNYRDIRDGISGVLRHEYGHAVHDLVSDTKGKLWRERFSNNHDAIQEISNYAQTNDKEYFAETYSLATDRRYHPDNYSKFANESVNMVRRWANDLLR